MNDEFQKLMETCIQNFRLPYLILWRFEEAKLFQKIEIRRPILDLGCGDGTFSQIMFKNSQIDLGIDIDQNVIEIAKEKRIYKHLIVADIVKFRLPEKYFSTIISNCVIERIIDDISVFRNVSQSLTDNGLFVFSVVSDNMPENYLLSRIFKNSLISRWNKIRRAKRFIIHHHYNIQELQRKLALSNLEMLEVYPYISPKKMIIFDILEEI